METIERIEGALKIIGFRSSVPELSIVHGLERDIKQILQELKDTKGDLETEKAYTKTLRAELATLRTRLAEAEKALEPIVKVYENHKHDHFRLRHEAEFLEDNIVTAHFWEFWEAIKKSALLIKEQAVEGCHGSVSLLKGDENEKTNRAT